MAVDPFAAAKLVAQKIIPGDYFKADQDWLQYNPLNYIPARLQAIVYNLIMQTSQIFMSILDGQQSLSGLLTTVFLSVVTVYLSLKVLDMMRRAVWFWISLAFRVAFWVGIGLCGLWVYFRGFEGASNDVYDYGNYYGNYWKTQYTSYKSNEQLYNDLRAGGANRGWW